MKMAGELQAWRRYLGSYRPYVVLRKIVLSSIWNLSSLVVKGLISFSQDID